ncbi:hypothetical protein [Microcystis sp. M043S2]|nr:hypothetical protein [Microcystis sp. M043S2]
MGFYRFSGGQLPNFQGKSAENFPAITPIQEKIPVTVAPRSLQYNLVERG